MDVNDETLYINACLLALLVECCKHCSTIVCKTILLYDISFQDAILVWSWSICNWIVIHEWW